MVLQSLLDFDTRRAVAGWQLWRASRLRWPIEKSANLMNDMTMYDFGT